MLKPDKMHQLLASKDKWDDATWFQVERYLLSRTSVPLMGLLVDLAGVADNGPLFFKTDMVKYLKEVSPQQLLAAWDEWRELRVHSPHRRRFVA